jgi:rare lipoprotein A
VLRPVIAMKRWRRARLGVGALILAVLCSVAALAGGQALAAPAPPLQITPLALRVPFLQDGIPVEATRLRVRPRRLAVLGGQAVQVRGWLLPGRPGRRVSLQARQGGRWQTLAMARTGAAGRFVLRYVAGAAGQERVRVNFAGDRLDGRSAAAVGQMTVYREAGASWYNDGGNTACGFHAHYGVANRTLPCGTTVSLRYNGRSVTATVDDRGPYVGGRDWDLDQTTASALGFGGVGTVWVSG